MKLYEADRRQTQRASFTQEERLVHGRKVSQQSNVLVFGCSVEGELDTRRLEAALAELQSRHESVRIVFPEGSYDIALRPADELDFAVLSAEGDTPEESWEAARRLVAETAAVPFDLASGPLLRVRCIRVAPAHHLVGFVLDHVIADGESCRILAEDLFALYAAGGRGGAGVELPRLPFQFLDFAHSERRFLAGREREKLLSYWRRKLDGVATVPLSRLRDPAIQDGAERRLRVDRITVDQPLHAGLMHTVRRQRVTLTAVCAAALKVTVRHHRLALGESDGTASDVAIMGSLANRSQSEVRRAVGYFATPCVLRTTFSGEESLAEVAQSESRTIFGALRHQELPHALIARELHPDDYGIRYLSATGHGPRYVNFDLTSGGSSWKLQADGLTVTTVRIARDEVPRGGMRVHIRDSGGSALVELRTDTGEYRAQWAQEFLADYMSVLRRFAADSDTRVAGAVSR
ncbi:condensation domain-containing protein [Streptomyces sp. NBC_00654]|uniref:condensation domain-containing protein n=1 Tax=Streptomyces sp. NBC_00654 TaxID=2975799 RepID=UPI0022547848|nr:condensation domain-containing protein [Streptomyces sp. NBC_00654]MCX4966430.1 condensation domain-containing protein [Streptomyces sp. NBC_00654]